jgi:multimeric flavodoxin WrbA
MARVAVFSSSPRRDRGGTGKLLGPFVAGLRAGGAEVDLVHLYDKTIGPCRGCYTCWLETPGRCVQRDAMDELLPMFARADTVVLATPVYVDGMTGVMKNFLDRCIPLIEPFFILRSDHCRHDLRAECRSGKLALVSTCGFTELDNFEPLLAHVKAACRNFDREFAGALLRPYAASLDELARHGLPVADVLDAMMEAGQRLAERGHIPQRLVERVGRELMPRAMYIQAVNESFRRRLQRGGGQ